MTRVFLIRHAEPAAAWGGADDDPGLTEKGQAQALAAARTLADLGALDVLSSPMRRCRETAAPYVALRGVEPRIEGRVSEVVAPVGVTDRGGWLRANFPWSDGVQRKRWDEIDAGLRHWRDDAVKAMSELNRDTVVFTHFIAINAIVSAVTRSAETIVWRPGHASITELAFNNGEAALVRIGDEMRSEDVR